MKVSVIIPVYNGAKTIRETLFSVLRQTYKNLEVLVVDDCSTDASLEVIESFSDERLQVIKVAKNSGSPAKPRNMGVAKSSGEIIALCDQDDIWYPEKIEKQIKAYERSPFKAEIGIVYSLADFIDEKGNKTGRSEKIQDTYLGPKESFDKLLLGDFITACSALIQKKALIDAGGFKEELKGNDEYELFLNVVKNYGILALNEPLCAWRSGNGLSQNISKIYIENEKIFHQLESREQTEGAAIIAGHSKNLSRIIVTSIIEKEFEITAEYIKKSEAYPRSKKVTILESSFRLNMGLAYLIVSVLMKLGFIKV